MQMPGCRTLLSAFVALWVFSHGVAAQSEDPGKILNQYAKAAGGSSKLAKVQTLSLEGTLTRASDGAAGAFTLRTKSPNRYYLEILVDGKPQILSYNGKSAWSQTSSGELRTLLAADALQVEAAAQHSNGGMLLLKKNKVGVAFVGHADVLGHDAVELEFTTPSGMKRQTYFDPATHLIVRDSAVVAGEQEDWFFSDYKAETGIQVPRRIELHRGSNVYRIVVSDVSVNGTIGERVFDFPIKSQVKLPDLKALFKEIDENQKALDKIKENYAGTRVEEETEFEKTGKVTKRELKEYTFFYFQGEEVSTLVKEDGKPLSESRQKEENEKTRKRINEMQEQAEKKEAKAEKKKEEGKAEKDDDEPGIEVFLRVSQFVNPRRERFRGQDVLVFDFEPNPEYKPKNLVEKVVSQLAGVAWVDEKAHQVARLEAYFVGDVKIGGGLLANLQKGTSFVLEQSFLNNEVWLPTYEEAHVGVRVLLVKGFKVNVVTRYSDYQRFNVEMLNTIGKPKEVPQPDKQ